MTIPVQSAASSPLDGASLASVNEDSIRALVHRFYASVQKDELIGPIFDREIASERWPVHLEKMCAFWSSLLLKTRGYEGRPLSPHLRMDELSDEHFQRWIKLFRATANEVFEAGDAAAISLLAERIAHRFRLAIAFHRGEDTTNLKPFVASH